MVVLSKQAFEWEREKERRERELGSNELKAVTKIFKSFSPNESEKLLKDKNCSGNIGFSPSLILIKASLGLFKNKKCH